VQPRLKLLAQPQEYANSTVAYDYVLPNDRYLGQSERTEGVRYLSLASVCHSPREIPGIIVEILPPN
jgi:hypothetical protein